VSVEREHPGELEVETRVEAPPDVVFSFFTEPEKYRRWKGEEADLDPRPGGRYRVKMDETNVVRGQYVDVDPPRRVVFTWGFEGNEALPPGTSRVEVTLVPDGEATIVRLRHTGLPDEEARSQHETGWRLYLGRLAAAAPGEA
jgi:uncharacterized protein YndB with AHSA1/START domain